MATQSPNGGRLDEAVSATLAQGYGLQILSACPHRKVWQLETSQGPKYLKKTKLNAASLYFIHEALEYLVQQGFPTVPRFRLDRDGKPFVQNGADRYVLTDWYDATELDFQVLTDLQQACRLLAIFHLKSRGFQPSRPSTRTVWLDWPAKWEKRIRELQTFRDLARADSENSPFSRLYLRHFEPFYRQANLSYQWLLKSPYPEVAAAAARERSFCHHDYSDRNLLRTTAGQIIMVDFDYCLSDLRIHDLVNLLVRNLKYLAWNSELGKYILTQYHQTAPLSREELQVMWVLLSWPQDFWQVGLQFYVEKLPWPKARFLRKLERKLRQRFDRERFLSDFSQNNGIYTWKKM